MTNTPLNPDALEEASNAVRRIALGEVNSWDVAEAATKAYLAVAQPVVNSGEHG